jgi:hypothetical protein
MGLIDHKKSHKSVENARNIVENTLTLEEVDIVIRVMGSATFPVKDIEPLYRAIFKLQELRNKLKNNAT